MSDENHCSMKISPHDPQRIEHCLSGQAGGMERTLFQTKLLLEPTLQETVDWQRRTYGIIRAYGRRQLRDEFEQLHRILLTDPRYRAFREEIDHVFST